MIRYENINPTGRLFGGQLVSWIDEVAGACAMRHTGLHVTTASIDNLTFKRGAYLADRLVLLARMTFVGRSSCEVRVDSYIEDKEGFRHTINRAFPSRTDWKLRPSPSRRAGTARSFAATTARPARISDSESGTL